MRVMAEYIYEKLKVKLTQTKYMHCKHSLFRQALNGCKLLCKDEQYRH